jgi:hypothetical protein
MAVEARTPGKPDVNRFSITRQDFVDIGAATIATGAAINATFLEPAPVAGPGEPDAKICFAIVDTSLRGCDLLRSGWS